MISSSPSNSDSEKKPPPRSPDTCSSLSSPSRIKPRNVCIIGAGFSGLYSALLLESLHISNLSIHILEASSRPGGRLYTHRFSPAVHDYVDMGAMRYPRTRAVAPLFALFEDLSVPVVAYQRGSKKNGARALFNGRACRRDQLDGINADGEEFDPCGFSISKGGSVPDYLVAEGADAVLDRAFGPWIEALDSNFEAGLAQALRLDHLSIGEFLKENAGFNESVVEWLASVTCLTNLKEQGFVEALLDSWHFSDNGYEGQKEWACIDGGAERLVSAMMGSIRSEIALGKRVTAVKRGGDELLDVHFEDQEASPQLFDAVLCSVPLPCLRDVDLGDLGLCDEQTAAVETLHYDSAVKIAIKFDRPWWSTDCGIDSGGTSITDLPLRTCIYPSYGLGRDEQNGVEKCCVLICSYTWGADAQRIGRLVRDGSPEGEHGLRDMLLEDLAKLHQPLVTEGQLRESYVTHFAVSWDEQDLARGAFALCSPGEFSSLCPALDRTAAEGRFFFIGEAASPYHGWVIGALESAYQSVSKMLDELDLHCYRSRLEQMWKKDAQQNACRDNGSSYQALY